MRTLEEHNDEVLDFVKRMTSYPKPNDIACPKCGEELMDTDNRVLTSNPPQRNIHCPSCGYRGYRF